MNNVWLYFWIALYLMSIPHRTECMLYTQRVGVVLLQKDFLQLKATISEIICFCYRSAEVFAGMSSFYN